MKLSRPFCCSFLLTMAGATPAQNIADAINGAVDGVVNLQEGVTYTGTPRVNQDLIINGNGATVDLSTNVGFKTFRIAESLNVTLRDLTVTNGDAAVDVRAHSHVSFENVTISNSNQGIVSPGGTGSMTIDGSTFDNITTQAINGKYSTSTEGGKRITVRNSTINNTQFGILNTAGTIFVEDSTITNVEQGIVGLGGLASEEEWAEIKNVTIRDASLFGVYVRDGGYVMMENTVLESCQIAVELENSAEAKITNTRIDSQDIYLPGVAIGLRTGAKLELRESHLMGHLNSVDMRNSTAIIEDSILDNPIFSGVICLEDSYSEVRRTSFPDNGQDGFFSIAINDDGPDYLPSSGILEDCIITNAGDEPANPDLGVQFQAGSGILISGGGPWRISNCYIENAFDVGMGIQEDADVTVESCVVLNNQKSGISLSSRGEVTFRDTLVTGHKNEAQAGVSIHSTTPIPATFDRVALVDNSFGVIYSAPGEDTLITNSVIAGNGSQGISLNHQGPLVSGREGAMKVTHSGIFENAAHQVFVTSQGLSTFVDCSIWGSNGMGLFTNRGPCSSASGLRTNAIDNFWGRTDGPIDSCLNSLVSGAIDVQNTDFNPWNREASDEYYVQLVGQKEIYHSRTGPDPWLTLSGLSGVTNGTPLAVTRYLNRTLTAAPPTALNETFVTWSTPEIQESGGTLLLRILNPPVSGPIFALERVNPETGEVLSSHKAISDDLELLVSIPAEQFASGVWYLRRIPSVTITPILGSEKVSLDSDRNNDGILDAADILIELRLD